MAINWPLVSKVAGLCQKSNWLSVGFYQFPTLSIEERFADCVLSYIKKTMEYIAYVETEMPVIAIRQLSRIIKRCSRPFV